MTFSFLQDGFWYIVIEYFLGRCDSHFSLFPDITTFELGVEKAHAENPCNGFFIYCF